MNVSKVFLVFLAAAMLLSACTNAEPAAPDPTQSVPSEGATAAPAAQNESAPAAQGCLGSAEKAVVDLNCREITIAVENAYLPFNYISIDTGKPGGWDYDAWNEICTRLHCTPVFTEAAWDGMIQAVADKQYDLVADGLTITEERLKIIDASIGYMKIQQRLLARNGETRFSSIEDIANNKELRLGTQTATTNYETAAKYLPEDRIQAFEQMPFAVQALISGDLDAVLIDEVVGLGYQGQNKEQVELIGDSMSSDELGFLFPKGSDLVAPVNRAIESMAKDGTLEKINLKYFGPDFKITYDDIKKSN